MTLHPLLLVYTHTNMNVKKSQLIQNKLRTTFKSSAVIRINLLHTLPSVWLYRKHTDWLLSPTARSELVNIDLGYIDPT